MIRDDEKIIRDEEEGFATGCLASCKSEATNESTPNAHLQNPLGESEENRTHITIHPRDR